MFTVTNRMRQKRIRTLADTLKAAEVGITLTHAQIAETVGLSVCPNELFQAAHRLANKESGCYFDSVRGEGYVRRPATEWDGVVEKGRVRVRRQASKTRKFVVNMVGKTNELTDDEQRRASREIGLMQTIEAMTRRIANQ